MARHVYTVVKPFRSVGPAGIKDYAVGDEVILDRPARPGPHLELVSAEAAKAAEDMESLRSENAALKALLEAGGGGSGPIKPQGEPGAEAFVAGGGGSGPIKPSRAR